MSYEVVGVILEPVKEPSSCLGCLFIILLVVGGYYFNKDSSNGHRKDNAYTNVINSDAGTKIYIINQNYGAIYSDKELLASYQDYDLTIGTPLSIIEKTTSRSGNIVMKVRTNDNKIGFIDPHCCDIYVPNNSNQRYSQSQKNKAYAIVTLNKVNIRSGNGTSYQVITTATKNEQFLIIGETQKWFKIKLTDGRIGWVSKSVSKKQHIK